MIVKFLSFIAQEVISATNERAEGWVFQRLIWSRERLGETGNNPMSAALGIPPNMVYY